jgi:hypothetical protein
MNSSGWSSTKCAWVWQKSGVSGSHSMEAFFCLDFFVTFFIKKKSKATGSDIDYEYFEMTNTSSEAMRSTKCWQTIRYLDPYRFYASHGTAWTC